MRTSISFNVPMALSDISSKMKYVGVFIVNKCNNKSVVHYGNTNNVIIQDCYSYTEMSKSVVLDDVYADVYFYLTEINEKTSKIDIKVDGTKNVESILSEFVNEFSKIVSTDIDTLKTIQIENNENEEKKFTDYENEYGKSVERYNKIIEEQEAEQEIEELGGCCALFFVILLAVSFLIVIVA